jgi:hypothetical protein
MPTVSVHTVPLPVRVSSATRNVSDWRSLAGRDTAPPITRDHGLTCPLSAETSLGVSRRATVRPPVVSHPRGETSGHCPSRRYLAGSTTGPAGTVRSLATAPPPMATARRDGVCLSSGSEHGPVSMGSLTTEAAARRCSGASVSGAPSPPWGATGRWTDDGPEPV